MMKTNRNFIIDRIYPLFILLALFMFLGGCEKKNNIEKVAIGFSQGMNTDDWRRQLNKSMVIEASLHPEVQLEIKDANNSVSRQVQDIEKFIARGVDVIIVSPIEAKPLTAVVQKSIEKGIPVIVLDRKIDSEDYTAYIGADNIQVGRIAAKYIVSNSHGTGKIIEITGLKTSSPAYERGLGFRQILNQHHNIKLTATLNGNWESKSIKKQLRTLLEKDPDIEYIFAHNDRMALGAWETAKELGLENKIKFVGVDALNTANGGIELVKAGVLKASILYPTGGNDALRLALKIYAREPVSKNNLLNTIVIDQINAEIIQNQMNKVDEQQTVIEHQLKAISIQEREYSSQHSLVRLLILFLAVILSLAIYSIYSTISISRKKRQLEQFNDTVTKQKNEIEIMAAAAQRSNEVKLSFFTGLSHEFKTPITLIMSYAESLIENDKIKGTRLMDELKLIYSNSNRLLRLINQLLDFRKAEEQKFSLKASKINLYRFTDQVMANFRGEAIRRNIDFRLLTDNRATEVFTDTGLMDKVYFNLLSNSFKFTPDNGKITISIKDNGDTVKIIVKDSGMGIPEKELPLVFNPFFKASNNNKSSSGIGLNLSREFILLHKGTIEVRSKQGTEFTISLPKGSEHLLPSEISTATVYTDYNTALLLDDQDLGIHHEVPKAILGQERYTLLVIEDHPDLINFLSTRLAQQYDILTSDGSNAVSLAFDHVPDIILCDINLVGTNGFEISEVLKKDLRTSHIPIIILSAQSNKESVIQAMEVGVDQYLTKPFSLSVLQQSLSSLLFNREKLRYYYTNNIYKVEPDAKFGFQEQNFITKMNSIIEENFSQPSFTVEDLAERLLISRVQLYRKVKAILGISISDHINNIKMERALELLRGGEMNISTIAYTLGFSSPNYFSTTFKAKYGVSPKEFKNISL